jgi:hypothetical protein
VIRSKSRLAYLYRLSASIMTFQASSKEVSHLSRGDLAGGTKVYKTQSRQVIKLF